MHKESETGLNHIKGHSVSHARIILDDKETGPVLVFRQTSQGKELHGLASNYGDIWSAPVRQGSEYGFQAHMENTNRVSPSTVTFTKEEISASMPEVVFREP